MTLNRRQVILTAAAAALLGGGALYATGLRRHLGNVLGRHFGTAANSEVARTFLDDWISKLEQDGKSTVTFNGKASTASLLPEMALEKLTMDDALEHWIVADFGQSTTIFRHLESGAPLEYFGAFDPYDAPCAHPLSVQML